MNELHFEKLSFDLLCPMSVKMIKVTSDFYNYLSARHKENIYFVNNNSVVLYFMGIPIVVDDGILSNYYELEF